MGSGTNARRFSWGRVVLALGALYLVWLSLLVAFQRDLVFEGKHKVPEPGAFERLVGAEVWWLDHEEGRTEAWWMPGKGVTDASPGPAVLYLHGAGDIMDTVTHRVERYRDLGISVLVTSYRGYARSDGTPTQETVVADSLAWYDRMAAHKAVDPERVVIHGRSLGSGPATQVARVRPPKAVVLISPYTSLRRFSWSYAAPGFLVLDPFDNAEAVLEMTMPVLVFHGRHDTTTPFTDGQELAELAPNGTLVGFDCNHVDMPVHTERWWAELTGFLKTSGVLPT